LAETFKGPILKSSRGVEITTQTGTVASAPWPALGGSCSLAGQMQEPRYQAVKADVATLLLLLQLLAIYTTDLHACT